MITLVSALLVAQRERNPIRISKAAPVPATSPSVASAAAMRHARAPRACCARCQPGGSRLQILVVTGVLRNDGSNSAGIRPLSQVESPPIYRRSAKSALGGEVNERHAKATAPRAAPIAIDSGRSGVCCDAELFGKVHVAVIHARARCDQDRGPDDRGSIRRDSCRRHRSRLPARPAPVAYRRHTRW